MTIKPPGLDPILLAPDSGAPSDDGAGFTIDESFASRDALLAAFPPGSYVLTVVDNGATVSGILETDVIDGPLSITTPAHGRFIAHPAFLITRTNQCSNCEEELVALWGVDGHNWEIFGQTWREERFPAHYTLSDLDWVGDPVTQLPDGRYQLELTAQTSEYSEPCFNPGNDCFFFNRRALTRDTTIFRVPEPNGTSGGWAALAGLASGAAARGMRRRDRRL